MKTNQILYKMNLNLGRIFPRASIKFMKRYFNGRKDLIGCEIGVRRGANAESIIRELTPEKIYLVDPYFIVVEFEGKDIAMNRLKKYKNVIWIIKKAEDSENDFKDKLDFVYIDGSHFYEDVKWDLEMSYRLVKKGGVIAGHDINQEGRMSIVNPELVNECGVTKAVLEFANKYKLKLLIDGEDWWMVK